MSSPVPRRKRLWQKIALFLATLVFCFGLLELILRLQGFGNLEIYQPDPILYWTLKPNQNCYTKIGHKPVRVNSHGTRGREFTPEKPAGTFRILSLGDSRTFGWGLAEEETYSAQLEKLLQDKAGNRLKIEVINAGVNAWSYPQLQVYFRDIGLRYHPDAVVIAEANLWTQFSEKNSSEFIRKFMWRVRLKNFLRRFATYHYLVEVKLKEVYERQRTKFIPVDPRTDPLFKEQQKDPNVEFRAALEQMCTLAFSNNIQPVLLHLPALDELDSTNKSPVWAIKQSLAETLNVPLVDVRTNLAPQSKNAYLEADPVHLNSPANRVVAERLAEAVAPLLPP